MPGSRVLSQPETDQRKQYDCQRNVRIHFGLQILGSGRSN
jgi:hypothetical protein